MPGRIGAIPTPALTPASTSSLERLEAPARRRGAGLGAPPDLLVERRHREDDADLGPRRRLDEDVEVADDHRAARDQAERVRRVAERLEAAAGQPVAALGRLVRVGRGADRDGLACPGRPRQLRAEAPRRRSPSPGSSVRSGRRTAGRRAARRRARSRTCSGGRSPCTGSATSRSPSPSPGSARSGRALRDTRPPSPP